jgi:hypothetical protein
VTGTRNSRTTVPAPAGNCPGITEYGPDRTLATVHTGGCCAIWAAERHVIATSAWPTADREAG